MAWQTTSNPKRNYVTLRFDDDEIRALDTEAARMGMSRSGFLRDCSRRVIAIEERKRQALKTGKAPGAVQS